MIRYIILAYQYQGGMTHSSPCPWPLPPTPCTLYPVAGLISPLPATTTQWTPSPLPCPPPSVCYTLYCYARHKIVYHHPKAEADIFTLLPIHVAICLGLALSKLFVCVVGWKLKLSCCFWLTLHPHPPTRSYATYIGKLNIRQNAHRTDIAHKRTYLIQSYRRTVNTRARL